MTHTAHTYKGLSDVVVSYIGRQTKHKQVIDRELAGSRQGPGRQGPERHGLHRRGPDRQGPELQAVMVYLFRVYLSRVSLSACVSACLPVYLSVDRFVCLSRVCLSV